MKLDPQTGVLLKLTAIYLLIGSGWIALTRDIPGGYFPGGERGNSRRSWTLLLATSFLFFFVSRIHLLLDSDQATALFRIFQDTLTNVARHSGASAVRVELTESQSTPGVQLVISDSGRGIIATELKGPNSLGLLGMRERATILGGTLSITGQRGKGVEVKVILPLSTESR